MAGILRTRARRSYGYDPSTFNRGIVAQTGEIPTGAQLIRDTWRLEIKDTKQIVTEGIGGREVPAYRITGLFQRADDANANFRVYPKPIIREAVEAIQQDIGDRAVMGEFDHPPDAKIHLDRVSHLITKIWMEGKNVYGEAEILDILPYGNQLRGLFERKVRVGISSRGIGDMEVHEDAGRQIYYVSDGYRFVTWDCVAEPSVSGAVLHLMESKNRLAPKPQRQLFSKSIYEAQLLKEFNEQLKRR